MARGVVGEVRTSQLITTYGVGSVVPVGDQSFIVAGIDQWSAEVDIHEPRLERYLGVRGFARPPFSEHGQDIPVRRFPEMHYCPECRRLDRHGFFTSGDGSECNNCQRPLIPSRFVMACEAGHIDDFPYLRWVHNGKWPGDGHRLSLSTTGRTASLRDIVITCSCGESLSLDGAFGKHALTRITKCTGRRPWLSGKDTEDCVRNPRTVQRGASNVWFSVTSSAISIPPWSDAAYKVLDRQWLTIKHIPDDVLATVISSMGLPERTGIALEDLVDAVIRRRAGLAGQVDSLDELKVQEFEALRRGRVEQSRDQDFVCETVEPLHGIVDHWFSQVAKVKRLREVRVLTGFRRLEGPGAGNARELTAPLARDEQDWYPAIEVIGEGIFLRLSEDRLGAWERQPAVKKRADEINRRYIAMCAQYGTQPEREISPRLLLTHALAHALINQLSLDCGYPAAALRERLYVARDFAAVLLYTATTDSAGSLGGVIAQADPERLEATVREALHGAAWCSSDPVCIETEAAGTDALNMAACHSCLLLPEVSCEEMNLLLDRAALVGTPDDPSIGFFAAVIAG